MVISVLKVAFHHFFLLFPQLFSIYAKVQISLLLIISFYCLLNFIIYLQNLLETILYYKINRNIMLNTEDNLWKLLRYSMEDESWIS